MRALSANPELIALSLVPRALLGLLALLCGNGYIVGINQARRRGRAVFRHATLPECAWPPGTQIYDISIDKVNKPFLPVASGEMTVGFAWFAVRTSQCSPARCAVRA